MKAKVKFFNTHISSRLYDLSDSEDLAVIASLKNTYGADNIEILKEEVEGK